MSKRWNAYKQYIGLTVLVVLIGVLFGMQKVSAANAAVMVVLTAAVFFLNKIENGKLQWLRHLVLLFANILFAFTILNSLTGFVNVLDLCKEIFLDILLVGFFYLIIAGISGSVRFTVWTGNILATVFMVVNIFLQDVRGRKLNYFDISSLGTALNVAGQYRLKLTLSMVLAVVTLILFTWWSMQGLQKLKQDYRFYIGRGCFAAAGIFVFFLCIGTGFLKKFGVYDRAWDYDQESILLNFIVEYRETCTTEDDSFDKEELELYLSLMKESDKALEQLITYFEAVDEPVAILLFGDHQPGIEYAMEKGEEAAPMDKYAVPFFLWTNYETKEEQVEAVSMNYLPVLLAEKTQTPMNAYFRYLQDLYTKYPVVTGEGAIDRNGEYKERTDSQLQQDLLEYEYVMYYRLTGSGEEYESYFGY